jgi:RND family efflux transporter MFP subunit
MGSPPDLTGLRIEREDRGPRPRRRTRRWVWPAVVLAALALAALLFVALTPPAVQVASVTRASVLASGSSGADGGSAGGWTELHAAGYLVADRQSTVASRFTGRLLRLLVREAAKVTQGQLLGELDHRDLDATITAAEADCEQMEAAQKQADAEIQRATAAAEQFAQAAAQSEAEVAAAQATVQTMAAEIVERGITLLDAERRRKIDEALAGAGAAEASRVDDRRTEVRLAEARILTAQRRLAEAEKKIEALRAQAAASRSAVKTAEAQVLAARAARGAAEAQGKAARARLAVLKAQREDYFIRSPFEGIVTERIAEEGEIVAPISIGGSMARGAIVTIADWASLQAEVDVAEAYLERVQPGGRAGIAVDAIPNRIFPGRVDRILPRVDRGKATVKVRVSFLEREAAFKPDMGVRVKFVPPNAPEGAEKGLTLDPLVVPAAALVGDGQGKRVWVVEKELARAREVQVGAARGDGVEVLRGLKDGEQVVVRGAETLSRDGQKVRVVSEAPR